MAKTVKAISEDSQFQTELAAAEAKLVVVDFFATWLVKSEDFQVSLSLSHFHFSTQPLPLYARLKFKMTM